MSKTVAINTNLPPDTGEPVKFAASRMREIKAALLEFLGVDHYLGTQSSNGVYDDDNGGNHKLVTIVPINYSFTSPVGKTDTVMAAEDAEPHKGKVYTKVVTISTTDYVELFWMDDAGNEIQLTDRGRLPDVLATYFTDPTGTTDPEGRFRIRADGDAFKIEEKTDDDPETWQSVISWTREGDVTLGNKPTTALASGNCSVTNGSDAVVWVSDNTFLSSYSGKTITIGGVAYTVESVEDTTHLTLTSNYAGITSSEVAFAISSVQRNFKNVGYPVDLNDAVNKAYLDSYLKYFEVKQAVLTDTKQFTGDGRYNDTWTAIDDAFYVSITPESVTNKVRVQATIHGSTNSSSWVMWLKLQRKIGDGLWTDTDAIGGESGDKKRATTCLFYRDTRTISCAAFDFLDNPATTSEISYRVVWNIPVNNAIGYINKGHNEDTGESEPYSGRTISTITAQQVK